MHVHNKPAEFFLSKILDFIDEDGDSRLSLPGGIRNRKEHIGQIHFDVSTVGCSSLGFYVKSEFDISDLHPY